MIHYAFPMSTADHNHLYSEYELYDYQYGPLKKNPDHENYKFPKHEVDGKEVDNDIYQWIGGTTNYNAVYEMIPKLQKIAIHMPQAKGTIDAIIESAQNLLDIAGGIMVKMQTTIVPKVEKKVRAALKTGKTLTQIVKIAKQKTKSNPRPNTSRRRRYY